MEPPVGSWSLYTRQQLGLYWDSSVRADRKTAALSPAATVLKPVAHGGQARRKLGGRMTGSILVLKGKKSIVYG